MDTHHDSEEIARQQQHWQTAAVAPMLTRFPERQPHFTTSSGIPLQRLYTPLDSPDADYLQQRSFPGQFPFTRGVHPSMYRGRLWTMRQYAGFGTAEVSNQRYKFLLERGQRGLSVAFDLPTQIGYDADHPMAAGEVGKVGVAIASLQDMETLFKDIPLDRVSTSMTINATAATLLALYIAVAKKQGVAPAQLTGTIQNDILKEYIARGTYIYPPKPSMRLITDVFAYAAREMPRWNTISISGYHIREAGSTAVQEVAFTLANGIAYVEAALEMGLDVNQFGTQLSFFFNVHNHFLEEIAKFRAARRLWARIMRDRFHATEPRAQMLRFHAQTAGSTLTAQQPDNNVVRVALQALAAVLGGAQSLHTNSRDEALALPTEEAVQIALRTQQIIAYETGVAKSVDPVGGAYAIEALTDAIEERAQAYIAQIDAMGGAVRRYGQRALETPPVGIADELLPRPRLVQAAQRGEDAAEALPPREPSAGPLDALTPQELERRRFYGMGQELETAAADRGTLGVGQGTRGRPRGSSAGLGTGTENLPRSEAHLPDRAGAEAEMPRSPFGAPSSPSTPLPDLIAHFLALHRALEAGDDAMRSRELLIGGFGRLFRRHGSGGGRIDPAPRDRARLAVADALMRARHAEALKLDDIAAAAGLTAFQLIGLFRRTTGLTPHAYLTQLRLGAACRLLRHRTPPAECAAEVGFYDQSALNKHFKRCYGITPLQFQKAAA